MSTDVPLTPEEISDLMLAISQLAPDEQEQVFVRLGFLSRSGDQGLYPAPGEKQAWEEFWAHYKAKFAHPEYADGILAQVTEADLALIRQEQKMNQALLEEAQKRILFAARKRKGK